MKELRSDFQRCREQKGMSQRDLAEKAKVMQCTISRYENGLQDVELETLVRIARAIGNKELLKLIRKALVDKVM